jgi:hypothetical protein
MNSEDDSYTLNFLKLPDIAFIFILQSILLLYGF